MNSGATGRMVLLFCAFLISFSCKKSSSGPGSDKKQLVRTMEATVGGQAYKAAEITVLTTNGRSVLTRSADGQKLDLTFIGISGPGQYALINQATTQGPGVAGGYISAAGETYNIDSGTVSLTEYSDTKISGTFGGTASGLLGTPDLSVKAGAFSIEL